MKSAAKVVFSCFLLSAAVLGQSSTAQISGTVKDQTGAHHIWRGRRSASDGELVEQKYAGTSRRSGILRRRRPVIWNFVRA